MRELTATVHHLMADYRVKSRLGQRPAVPPRPEGSKVPPPPEGVAPRR